MRPRRPSLTIVAFLCAVPFVALTSGLSACSGAAGSGTTSLVVEVLPDAVTVENKTGTPLMRGEVSVVPYGTAARPYVVMLPHLSNGEKRSFPLTSFRNPDGTRFMRGAANGRVVRVSAKDVGGQVYEREVPFR